MIILPFTLHSVNVSDLVSTPGPYIKNTLKGGNFIHLYKRFCFAITNVFLFIFFIPVAVKSTGALGQDATDFLHELGRIAAATGDPRSSEYLFQRLSVAIQRCNAACVSGTCTDSCNEDFFFCLIICIKLKI